MDRIDRVYYINLDSREDRKTQFLAEMKKLGVSEEKIERIPGIPTPGFGILGCGLSHKKTVETFLESPYSNCLIFEDDFTVTQDVVYCHFLLRQIFESGIPVDLVMLSGNIMKDEPTVSPFLQKVLDGQTASGFFLTKQFAPKLVQCLSESTVLLDDWHKKTGQKKHEYCNDIYWKQLQPISNWFILKPKLGIQRESYSDNELRVTNYGV
jgi:GR25 family glycosyltransferase involved in LPS biosynthesis